MVLPGAIPRQGKLLIQLLQQRYALARGCFILKAQLVGKEL
jgi:hypothetical protein